MTIPRFGPWQPHSGQFVETDLTPEELSKVSTHGYHALSICQACGTYETTLDKPTRLCRPCWRVVVLRPASEG